MQARHVFINCHPERSEGSAVRTPDEVYPILTSDNLSQPPQILLRLPHVAPDLLFQRFDRRKLDLVPQTIQEMKFDFRLRRKCERVKVQQMSFNSERVSAERGPVSNVR